MQKNHGRWVWLVALEECWKDHVLSSRLGEGTSLGKAVAECLCLGINFLHLLVMWQNETNTVQLLCDGFFFFFLQGGHLRQPQIQSGDVSNNSFDK